MYTYVVPTRQWPTQAQEKFDITFARFQLFRAAIQ